ncbi:hypothetical protein SKAU_G00199040 [Synaphobranchus kaupii]|uniref:Uncharacterized protein n=1 Tax=Synaphobranchus kaupii TaxID=118154 RepID=A0A9Q1FFG1_SYNKA|nr:hypothetical protein SKAU_G00199040 [Synaphobranchus kaupii]
MSVPGIPVLSQRDGRTAGYDHAEATLEHQKRSPSCNSPAFGKDGSSSLERFGERDLAARCYSPAVGGS